jgi:precorrin-2 dehydrogenase/sirohydrochlorin ferrochelatase
VPHDYPIFLDVSRLRIVIVGGGTVAARKAAAILAAGGKSVRAVAPKFCREFPAEVEKKAANFDAPDLDGAELVFAATDSATVNDAVAAEARNRGIWVQRGDENEDEPGDFISPALLRCGPIVVAVSAGGSPALAAALRDLLAGTVTDQWVELAEAMKKLRPQIKSSGLAIPRRREIFRALATTEAAAALEAGGVAGLRKWLRGKFADLPELENGGVG